MAQIAIVGTPRECLFDAYSEGLLSFSENGGFGHRARINPAKFCAGRPSRRFRSSESASGLPQLPARKGQSSRSSNSQVRLPCFLGSGHWIGGTLFSRLIGSNAAVGAIHDAVGMGFEWPVSGVNLPLRGRRKIPWSEKTGVA